MPTSVPNRRSIYGISCIKCSNKLIAPAKSEFRGGADIRHTWVCPNCTTSFDSLEQIPVEEMTSDDVVPPLLVAWSPR